MAKGLGRIGWGSWYQKQGNLGLTTCWLNSAFNSIASSKCDSKTWFVFGAAAASDNSLTVVAVVAGVFTTALLAPNEDSPLALGGAVIFPLDTRSSSYTTDVMSSFFVTSLCKHWSQVLLGLLLPETNNLARLQSAHTTFPQARQWCLRETRENFEWHRKQLSASSSSIHGTSYFTDFLLYGVSNIQMLQQRLCRQRDSF